MGWNCGDPDGGPLLYDVYFGSNNPPPLVSEKQSDKSYDPGAMDNEITYYWQIVAFDNEDASTSGPLWSFTTEKKKNKAPVVKIISPTRALYIFNTEILPRLFRPATIIGRITIEAEANDDSGIDKVEFYINGKLKGDDTSEPYTYEWTRDRLRFFHIFVIKAMAYDVEGETAVDQKIVRKIL